MRVADAQESFRSRPFHPARGLGRLDKYVGTRREYQGVVFDQVLARSRCNEGCKRQVAENFVRYDADLFLLVQQRLYRRDENFIKLLRLTALFALVTLRRRGDEPRVIDDF